ncbi:MGH1-like glycoside hydrolase domain-containing protein [Paenibacillus medicaginis]|uniref:Mannosylglycerate hydrolase MGH1-like glycoside hydrolase domain-containing protein n=1 Tax=Paenibacillus medicaginis TaxID=1470560 RepID=A0ABV5C0F5_9BACL
MREKLLKRLRSIDMAHKVGQLKKESDAAVLAEWERSGGRFASTGQLETVYYHALGKLLDCIVPTGGRKPILHEGGVYLGCWLESTGTINAELLARFIPSVSESTYRAFAAHQRGDGLLPYKVTADGPVFRQIQMVTPLARSVWNYDALHGRNDDFLRTMYSAMSRHDQWLAEYRNTRRTGGVEAFCTFDTGHDLSPRFWHVPDTPHLGDPARCYPDSPLLPFIAPDLTANVHCQRTYLARIAEALGENGEEWRVKAEKSLQSLFTQCFDTEDYFFYDRDRHDRFVRVQSDVLLRVMACEVGDRAFFDTMLQQHLLNTRKFFAKYPFTSLAMDDPRFDPFSSYNSWSGPSNFLSLIRAPHAFEHHGRHVELTWVMLPILAAMARMKRFAQCLSPWTGEEGFTEVYSPAILCVLDYVERLCGIMLTPDGELWFTGLVPYDFDHGEEVAPNTAYGRSVDGTMYELINLAEGSEIVRDGESYVRFPAGVRIITDRSGRLKGILGMSTRTVEGSIWYQGAELEFSVNGNELLVLQGRALQRKRDIGLIYPTY